MYPYILCYCGRSLGDLYDLFNVLRAAKYTEAYVEFGEDIDPAFLAISDLVQVDLTDVFDALHIHMECCKVRIQTQVEFKNVY